MPQIPTGWGNGGKRGDMTTPHWGLCLLLAHVTQPHMVSGNKNKCSWKNALKHKFYFSAKKSEIHTRFFNTYFLFVLITRGYVLDRRQTERERTFLIGTWSCHNFSTPLGFGRQTHTHAWHVYKTSGAGTETEVGLVGISSLPGWRTSPIAHIFHELFEEPPPLYKSCFINKILSWTSNATFFPTKHNAYQQLSLITIQLTKRSRSHIKFYFLTIFFTIPPSSFRESLVFQHIIIEHQNWKGS